MRPHPGSLPLCWFWRPWQAAVAQERGSPQMERRGLPYRALWEGTGHLKVGLRRTEPTGDQGEKRKKQERSQVTVRLRTSSCQTLILNISPVFFGVPTHRGPLLLSFLYCSVHKGPVFVAVQGHTLHPWHTEPETVHNTVQHTLLHTQHPVDLSGGREGGRGDWWWDVAVWRDGMRRRPSFYRSKLICVSQSPLFSSWRRPLSLRPQRCRCRLTRRRWRDTWRRCRRTQKWERPSLLWLYTATPHPESQQKHCCNDLGHFVNIKNSFWRNS